MAVKRNQRALPPAPGRRGTKRGAARLAWLLLHCVLLTTLQGARPA